MTEREKAVKCLRELRNLLTDDEDLRLPIHDEKFLIRFVRGKKYDAAKAHETVRKYFTLKKNNPKIFKTAYPSYEPIKDLLENNAVMKLKHNALDGRAVIAFNLPKWDLEKHHYGNMIQAFILVVEELLLFSVEAQIRGVIVICNDEGLTFSHLTQCTPGRLRTIFQVVQGSFPLRLKQTILVKEPPIIDKAMTLIKPFMSAKFKERMVFCGQNLEKLHAIVSAENLPEDFGGKLTEDEAYDQTFKENLLQRDNYYKDLLEYGFGVWDSDEEDTYM